MEQETQSPTTGEPTPPAGTTPELVRPQSGRVLAGVAQGLANRFDVPVGLVRAAFVVTAFFGGLGLALYAAGWGLIRSDDEPDSPLERSLSGTSGSRSWVGIALIFVAALILLDNLTFLSGGVVWAVALLVLGVLLYTGYLGPGESERAVDSSQEGLSMTDMQTRPPGAGMDTPSGNAPSGGGAPPTPTPTPPLLPPSAAKPAEKSILGRLTMGMVLIGMGVLALLDNIPGVPIDAQPRHYMALAVTILGLGLIIGAFAGRARWLIIVGAILVPSLLFSPVFEWDWTSDSFDASYRPVTFEEVAGGYALDVGNMTIDLTDLDWDGQTIDLVATVDAGNLEIRIPDDVNIVGEASVDVGRVAAPGRESAGLGDPKVTFNETDGDAGTLLLDAHVDVGNIEIRR